MQRDTIQFPLCGLAYGSDVRERVRHCIAWGIVEAGKLLLGKTDSDDVKAKVASFKERHDKSRRLGPDSFAALALGSGFVGKGFKSPDYAWDSAEALSGFVTSWKAKGRKSPLVRVPIDIAAEVAWEHGDYKLFSVLCAANCVIGSKTYCPISRSRIIAGSLGYCDKNMLLAWDGTLSPSGRELLAERADGIKALMTQDQARYWLDKLVGKKLLKRYRPPAKPGKNTGKLRSGKLPYYSKFLEPETILQQLVNKQERKNPPRSQPMVELERRLELARRGPLCGDTLCGELPPHNDEAPHNGETPAPPPPNPQPFPAQPPHNASSNASPNASENASPNAWAHAPESFEKEDPEPETKPEIPTIEQAMEFANGFTKKMSRALVTNDWHEWYLAYEPKPKDWKQSLAHALCER